MEKIRKSLRVLMLSGDFSPIEQNAEGKLRGGFVSLASVANNCNCTLLTNNCACNSNNCTCGSDIGNNCNCTINAPTNAPTTTAAPTTATTTLLGTLSFF